MLDNPALEDPFSPATDIAASLVNTLLERRFLLALPLGPGSWEAARKDAIVKVKELDKWQLVSEF
jgi:hypothetical protein